MDLNELDLELSSFDSRIRIDVLLVVVGIVGVVVAVGVVAVVDTMRKLYKCVQ